jgi:hypothetical protein
MGTVKDLIDDLNKNYQPDEEIAYIIYSKADVEPLLKDEHDRGDIDADEVWKEIAVHLKNGLHDSQEGVIQFLSELVEEQVDLYEDPEKEEV